MSTSADRMRALRARRAAAIEADPDAARLRDVDQLLAPAVTETIAALEVDAKDTAAAALALRYAQIIDECRDPSWGLRWIGPELLRALGELGVTPAARAKLPKGKPEPGRPNWLDEMRKARRTYPGAQFASRYTFAGERLDPFR